MDGTESKVPKEYKEQSDDKNEDSPFTAKEPGHEDEMNADMQAYEEYREVRRQSLENKYKNTMDSFTS